MAENATDLNAWVTKIQKANDAKTVLAIMDQFRKESWTDEQRARIAKVYVRVLERVGAPPPDESANAAEAEKNDGPVWYEKM